MNKNLIYSQINRAAKNLLIINLIIFIVSIAILTICYGEFKNVVLGPKQVRAGEVQKLEISGFAARNYVRITPEDKVSTGVEYVITEYENNQKKGETVEAVYYVLKDGQDLVFARIDPEKVESFSYTGWVRKMTSEEEDNLSESIRIVKEKNYNVSEYVLDTKMAANAPYVYVFLGAILIVSLINIIRSVGYFNCPDSHKIYKKLLKYGDVNSVINSIEEELSYDLFQNSKNIYILKSWILVKKFFTTEVIKIDDIIWAYKKVTSHSVNFIPTGKSYELILCLKDRSQYSIGQRQQQIDNIMMSINQMYPWIILGFSEEIKNIWKSDHSQLINHVQFEKQKIMGSNA